ncbi:hypothetical protein KSC_102390 [Ktedonobacter sp. SOSP1-52]|uniref:hypothetical protein n=1 Tax=Ktedonobacter sp. SOSP1-52 TaxID=2778366 RepID=UPI0019151AA5|nr:hypothetical protein [Ktedonobacter sp. SOSP1-52]GHO71347.1 hypothetical protein KSC_102390 [Ktedonobacter sp. SOSP1-52]
MYHSQAYGYYYLFMLIHSEEKHSPQSYPATDRDKVIHLAECIAACAGAQERFP